MTQADQEFISVPVPREHVTKVYAFLAELAGTAESASGGEAVAEADGKYPYVEWSLEDLRRLPKTRMASVQTAVGVMDILAERPGSKMSYTSLSDLLGLKPKQLQGALAAFTRHIHKEYGRRNWPLEWAEAAATDNPDFRTESFYTMDESIARLWKDVRAT
ncbi:hypothetical protein [Streptomyces vastus]|uniref:MarR family transcriptional regulator n=1 Tax=Streptomyces vastus TaxID=285451 RepID=A0ABP6E001_9ACTN